MINVLVCGGRKFGVNNMDEIVAFFKCMHSINDSQAIKKIISGGASGADALAREWAEVNSIPFKEYPADWRHYGRSAGIRRNQQMLNEEDIDLVVAFPGGVGTADMVQRALANDINVLRIER